MLDGLRSGNAYYTQGDLVGPDLTFTANVVGKNNPPKTMGETLVVKPGQDVEITLTVTDPAGTNNSKYTFPNPSLAQIGINRPLNQPVLDHIDLIGGNVTGLISPSNAVAYKNGTNPSAHKLATYDANSWTAAGTTRTITYVIHNVRASQYIRARGTNLPANTPNETDVDGNPLSDPINTQALINCSDAACPAHLTVVGGQKKSTFDVQAWADLWFYTNPIVIRLQSDAPFKVETEAKATEALHAANSN